MSGMDSLSISTHATPRLHAPRREGENHRDKGKDGECERSPDREDSGASRDMDEARGAARLPRTPANRSAAPRTRSGHAEWTASRKV